MSPSLSGTIPAHAETGISPVRPVVYGTWYSMIRPCATFAASGWLSVSGSSSVPFCCCQKQILQNAESRERKLISRVIRFPRI